MPSTRAKPISRRTAGSPACRAGRPTVGLKPSTGPDSRPRASIQAASRSRSTSSRQASRAGLVMASTPLEHGLALLQEGAARLLAVFAAEGAPDVGDLEAQLALDVSGLVGARDATFQQPQRDRRPGAELLAVGGQPLGEGGVVDRLAGH